MRAVVQRVNKANVTIEENIVGNIEKGLMVLLGVEDGDTIDDVKYMVEKITNLRIFEDEDEKLNLSVLDIGGEILVVSQFTLLGDCRKGRRPNFMKAAKPDIANKLYEDFVCEAKKKGINVETGVFREHMIINLSNDGPVTILIDSNKTF